MRSDWKKDTYYMFQIPPYISGYAGYIPGFNRIFGLTFRKAVEKGAVEWREIQNKLKVRTDKMQEYTESVDPSYLLSQVERDNMDIEVDHGHIPKKHYFDNQVTAENPPIVGYTGHIPGAKGEVALSKGYAEAAREGLKLLQMNRETRFDIAKNTDAVQEVLD